MKPDVWVALVPVLVPFVVEVVKLAAPKVPKQYLPLLAIFLGVASQLVQHFQDVGVENVLVGAILGGAGVGLRELIVKVQELLAPPAPPAEPPAA